MGGTVLANLRHRAVRHRRRSLRGFASDTVVIAFPAQLLLQRETAVSAWVEIADLRTFSQFRHLRPELWFAAPNRPRSNGSGSSMVTEAFVYSYLSSGVNAGLLSGVVWRTKVGSGSWSGDSRSCLDGQDTGHGRAK